jgi:hypothetical protein
VLGERLGSAFGEPSWAPDGRRVAWCGGNETVVHEIESGDQHNVPGCHPRFTPSGELLTMAQGVLNGSILRDGQTFLDLRDDPIGTPGLEILDYDESPDGLLVVTMLRLGPPGGEVLLELRRGTNVEASLELPRRRGLNGARFGEFVRFSPDGTVLAVGESSGPGPVTFVDLRLRRPSLELQDQRAFTWSPDGAWLAIAKAREIEIYSANAPEPVYRLPIRASRVGWAAPPSAEPEESGPTR